MRNNVIFVVLTLVTLLSGCVHRHIVTADATLPPCKHMVGNRVEHRRCLLLLEQNLLLSTHHYGRPIVWSEQLRLERELQLEAIRTDRITSEDLFLQTYDELLARERLAIRRAEAVQADTTRSIAALRSQLAQCEQRIRSLAASGNATSAELTEARAELVRVQNEYEAFRAEIAQQLKKEVGQ